MAGMPIDGKRRECAFAYYNPAVRVFCIQIDKIGGPSGLSLFG
jgi:hypothetical protein